MRCITARESLPQRLEFLERFRDGCSSGATNLVGIQSLSLAGQECCWFLALCTHPLVDALAYLGSQPVVACLPGRHTASSGPDEGCRIMVFAVCLTPSTTGAFSCPAVAPFSFVVSMAFYDTHSLVCSFWASLAWLGFICSLPRSSFVMH